MTYQGNIVIVATPGGGKTVSQVRESLNDQASLNVDSHFTLARGVLTHATGNVLYDNCSDLENALPHDLLEPCLHPDPRIRAAENHRRAEAFIQILTRRRDMGMSLAATPLMEEWIFAAILLWLCQSRHKPLRWLPLAFVPQSDEFKAMLRDCTLPEIRYKFEYLASLSYRALRAEVGSAARLLNSIWSPFFIARSRGGFNLGQFIQQSGKLILEKGDLCGDDTFRTIAGAVILLLINHAKRRAKPFPIIRCRIDEAQNAGLLSEHTEIKAAAELRKFGLFFTFILQRMNEDLLQLCKRHEYFLISDPTLARQAATDLAAGLPRGEMSRAEQIAWLADDLMQLKPGERWVRDEKGSRREYVPLLPHPWPDWGNLRANKLELKLKCIYSRPEYKTSATPENGDDETPPSSPSSPDTPQPPSKSPDDSSPVERWLREKRRRQSGSPDSAGESE